MNLLDSPPSLRIDLFAKVQRPRISSPVGNETKFLGSLRSCSFVMKEFTSEELASFDGKEDHPVYIALREKVYDVSGSRLWAKGMHMNRHHSGTDLSGSISAAPHGPEVLERFRQVGIVVKGISEEFKHLPPLLRTVIGTFPMMRRHPHPIFAHYPIAFLMATSLFVILHLLFQQNSLGVTGYYLLILGSISSPFAMGTGVLTWWINYRLNPNRFIRRKIQLSVLLLIFEIILISWRSSNPNVSHPIYYVMVCLLTPIVILLGYYGGQMTFPIEKE